MFIQGFRDHIIKREVNTGVKLMSREFSFERSFDEARRHLELAEKILIEGEKLINKDPVQASKKLYKVAEEAVKTIAIAFKLSEAEEAVKKKDGLQNFSRALW
jgi:capsule polysaccharide export protein KpsE/RkpR